MKLYFAGGETNVYTELLKQGGVRNRLVSYYYIKEDLRVLSHQFENQMLDSGAFTAWTKGSTITVEELAQFIKQYGDNFHHYINLDVIGNDIASYENYHKLKKMGINTVPVFHRLEDWQYLHKYCQESDYICIGGCVGFSVKELIPFLDHCFAIIKQYWPKKIHGLGITSKALMLRYPFYSVDSTSWLGSARFGGIMGYNDGKLVKYNSEYYNKLNKILNYKDKTAKAIQSFLQMETYITNLWTARGITWKE